MDPILFIFSGFFIIFGGFGFFFTGRVRIVGAWLPVYSGPVWSHADEAGGLCGSFAVILQALDGHGLTSFGHPVLVSFTIGFLVGIVLSTVLFSIIDSSVCAVIVCFAGSPVEFHHNHRELSHEMRHAWKEVWPGSVDLENVGPGTSPRTRPTL